MSLIKLTNQKSKTVDVNSDIRISYFTIQTNKGIGYVCMALSRPQPGQSNYQAAFSCYSPNEVKPFSKEHSRNSAVGRVVNWRTERKNASGEVCETNPRINFDYIVNSPDEKFNLRNVFERGLNLAMDSHAVPGWVGRSKKVGFGLNPKSIDLVSTNSFRSK